MKNNSTIKLLSVAEKERICGGILGLLPFAALTLGGSGVITAATWLINSMGMPRESSSTDHLRQRGMAAPTASTVVVVSDVPSDPSSTTKKVKKE